MEQLRQMGALLAVLVLVATGCGGGGGDNGSEPSGVDSMVVGTWEVVAATVDGVPTDPPAAVRVNPDTPPDTLCMALRSNGTYTCYGFAGQFIDTGVGHLGVVTWEKGVLSHLAGEVVSMRIMACIFSLLSMQWTPIP